MQIDRIKYTMKHRKAFRAVEKHLPRHHTLKARTHADYVQMVIDWECARLTKPDKQMNARETLDKLYPELKDKVLPVIEELGL